MLSSLFLIMCYSFGFCLDFKYYVYLALLANTLASVIIRVKRIFFVISIRNCNIIHMTICIENLFNSSIYTIEICASIYKLLIYHLCKHFIFRFIILFECAECVHKYSPVCTNICMSNLHVWLQVAVTGCYSEIYREYFCLILIRH